MLSKDLKIENISQRLYGGQSGCHTSSNIKVTHLPTGIYAVCGHERSQHKNRKVAMDMIEYGLNSIGWNDINEATKGE